MGLREAFKNGIELVRWNADPCIGNRKAECSVYGAFRVLRDSHCDGSAVGELDRVADEVEEYLVESVGVSD